MQYLAMQSLESKEDSSGAIEETHDDYYWETVCVNHGTVRLLILFDFQWLRFYNYSRF